MCACVCVCAHTHTPNLQLQHKLRKNEFILWSFFPRTFFQPIYHVLSVVLEFLKDPRAATPSTFSTLTNWLER